MPAESSLRFLEAMVNGLQENQPVCIRISSVKAVYWFCEAATSGNDVALNGILRSQISAIFQGLFTLANQPSVQVLILVMEAFAVLVEVGETELRSGLLCIHIYRLFCERLNLRYTSSK